MKPAIIILSLLGLIGVIGGIVFLVAGFAAAYSHCTGITDQVQLNLCMQQQTAAGVGVTQAGLGILMLVVGLICTFVGWLLGIIKTIQVKAWGWFAVVLILSPLGSLIYGIFGPFQPKEAAMAAPSMYQPPYQQ